MIESCTAERDTGPMLLAAIRALLVSRNATVLQPFLAQWPSAASTRGVSASSLPVLRWLSGIGQHASVATSALVEAIINSASQLSWHRTYSAADVGEAFLDNYGWAEIAGMRGAVCSETVACGFLLLGPATHYRRHRHEAEEVYIPLAGTASWQRGALSWQKQTPGAVIYHASNEAHAMRTEVSPLLALYVWRGHLEQKARFDSGDQ